LGGSILGILKYQDYLDSRIDNKVAARAIKTDRLSLAASQAYSGQWRRSLQLLDEIWRDPGFSSLDPNFKSFLFLNYVWVLGQVEGILPDGSWVGTPEWKRLNEDPDFVREFITGNSWEHDSDLNNSLGFCTLKFSSSNDLLRIARTYFQRAANDATPEQNKAPNIFALAMIDLIEDNKKSAAENMHKAEELYPEDYLISDRITYRNTFVNSTEFQIWVGVTQRVKNKDFAKLYDQFLKDVSGSGTS
jgi:tetratricopeptide (TPR) repeat protein